jgi:hypothetical protein
MVCCGKERKSRFCPDCGGHLSKSGDADALRALLGYCRAREREHRRSVEKAEDLATTETYQNGNPVPDYEKENCRKSAAKYRAQADQWQGFGDALAALMKAKGVA